MQLMHRFMTTCALMGCAALPSLSAEEGPGKAAAPAAGDSASTTNVRITPRYLEIENRISFDDDGDVDQEHKLNIQFNLHFNSNVFAIEDVTIDSLVYDNGSRGAVRNTSHHIYNRNSRQQGSLSVYADAPPAGAKKITAIKGSVEGRLANSLKQANIGPLSDWVGETVAIADADNLLLSIEKLNDGDLTISYDRELDSYVKEWQFLDAQGIKSEPRGWSSSSSGSTYERTYRDLNIDGQGSIALILYANAKTITVPIEASDIPLPSENQKSTTVDAVIKSHAGPKIKRIQYPKRT